ncbi:baseplate J/gp47 family protein [Cronobacter sakazakii]|uniref:baseplate J/gp47 family protein n=1 Tax=Cronobacter sakazakii TaxID=28141 RepID=UPI0023519A90|nr:baseplate J/gp47 family protein [Cronobacter sakazakii]
MFRHHAGRGTVGVMPANSDLDNPVPDETLIDAVKQYILPGSNRVIHNPIRKCV